MSTEAGSARDLGGDLQHSPGLLKVNANVRGWGKGEGEKMKGGGDRKGACQGGRGGGGGGRGEGGEVR